MLVGAKVLALLCITTMRTLGRHRTLHIALLIALLCMVGLMAFGGATLVTLDEGSFPNRTTPHR